VCEIGERELKRNARQPRAVLPEIEARIAVAVTESLPNLKTSTPPKTVGAVNAGFHAASKAIEHRKPCVMMIRAESIYAVHLRSALTVMPASAGLGRICCAAYWSQRSVIPRIPHSATSLPILIASGAAGAKAISSSESRPSCPPKGGHRGVDLVKLGSRG